MKRLVVLIILIFIFLIGVHSSSNKDSLVKVSTKSSIGFLEGSLDKQIFEYSVTLVNNDKVPFNILSLEPRLGNGFLERVENKDMRIEVNKSIAPKEILEIGGTVIFNAEGLSKEEVSELAPFIIDYTINEERVIR